MKSGLPEAVGPKVLTVEDRRLGQTDWPRKEKPAQMVGPESGMPGEGRTNEYEVLKGWMRAVALVSDV
jgi:hypothetical protein